MVSKNVDETLLYLAGLFEGEGSASIMRTLRDGKPEKYYYMNKLSMGMTDAEPIVALHKYFGGSFRLQEEVEGNRQRQYRWALIGRKAANAARKLRPFILSPRKQEALLCVITFSEHEVQRGLSSANYFKCRAYNAKGSKANNKSEAGIRQIHEIQNECITTSLQLELW